MSKEKLYPLISLVALALILLFCWSVILLSDVAATWKHYLGLALFLVPALLYFVNTRAAAVATGGFLLLASINALAITPVVSTWHLQLGPIETPPLQWLPIALLAAHYGLNRSAFSGLMLKWYGSMPGLVVCLPDHHLTAFRSLKNCFSLSPISCNNLLKSVNDTRSLLRALQMRAAL